MLGQLLVVTAMVAGARAGLAHPDLVFVPVPVPPLTAVAELRGYGDTPESKDIKGRVTFLQSHGGGPVFMFGNITGLKEGQHGFTVHVYGDTSEGCKSMGPHFNPHSVTHGGPADFVRHVGDLGNVRADKDGVAKISESDWAISLAPGSVNGIVGRGLVVYEKKDDLGRGGDNESLRSGNAGARLACGVVARAQSKHPPLRAPQHSTASTTKPPKR